MNTLFEVTQCQLLVVVDDCHRTKDVRPRVGEPWREGSSFCGLRQLVDLVIGRSFGTQSQYVLGRRFKDLKLFRLVQGIKKIGIPTIDEGCKRRRYYVIAGEK